jgi:hypothetical protein
MSRHIDIVLSCPPSADFPSLVEVQDAAGAPLAVGEWVPPTGDDPFWRFRLRVAEVLCMMVAPDQQIPTVDLPTRRPEATAAQIARQQAQGIGPSLRQARKDQLAGAKPRDRQAIPAPPPMVAPKKCPGCGELFDEAIHELVDCARCGEPKCTARCIGNTLEPCVDCQALVPDGDEGFDPNNVPDDAPGAAAAAALDRKEGRGNAAASHLYSGKVIGKQGAEPVDEKDE